MALFLTQCSEGMGRHSEIFHRVLADGLIGLLADVVLDLAGVLLGGTPRGNVTHLGWATGGSLVPQSEREKLLNA